jgi:hypothetical protein
MTLTVVGATMLAAITCHQLRQETLQKCKTNNPKDIVKTRNELLAKHSALPRNKNKQGRSGDGAASVVDDCCVMEDEASSLFASLSALAQDAVTSSIWCTCETSGCLSHATRFLECRICRVSCCQDCLGSVSGYNLSSHDCRERSIVATDRATIDFERRLREVLPPTLKVCDEGWMELKNLMSDDDDKDQFRVGPLVGSVFHLHRIKRDVRKWFAIYYVRENDGMGEAMAELSIVIGELSTVTELSPIGVRAEIKSFVPARTTPVQYGRLEPCCRLERLSGDNNEPETWRGNNGSVDLDVTIRGVGETPSIRKEIGLEDGVAADIAGAVRDKKDFAKAKERGEQRRWIYPPSWKTWPERIVIASAGNHAVCGEYCRAACRQTTNQSALWVKTHDDNDSSQQQLFIILRPNAHRTGPDRAVISSSIDFKDASAVVAELPRNWQPCDAGKTYTSG